jgi:hypothetical protein
MLETMIETLMKTMLESIQKIIMDSVIGNHHSTIKAKKFYNYIPCSSVSPVSIKYFFSGSSYFVVKDCYI